MQNSSSIVLNTMNFGKFSDISDIFNNQLFYATEMKILELLCCEVEFFKEFLGFP